jgi:hypothetical protein
MRRTFTEVGAFFSNKESEFNERMATRYEPGRTGKSHSHGSPCSLYLVLTCIP